MNVELITKHDAAKIIGVHHGTLTRYRQEGHLIEGVHYVWFSSQTVRYNKPLIADWAINRQHPDRHQRAIENYLRSLPSNQGRRKGR